MATRLSGIYAIIHNESGRHYIGSAVHISRRWAVHRAYLRRGAHQNSYLQRAWDKHGEAAFGFFVLELVEPERLIEVEQEWIDRYWTKGLYNRRRDASSNRGVRHSDASRAKIRAVAKARGILETTAQAAWKTNASRAHTDEEKERRAVHHRGAKRGSRTLERIRMAAQNRTAAHRAAIGASRARTYLVTAPDGQELTVTNMRAFCDERGLSQGHMIAVSKGKRRHHKGWIARPSEAPVADRYNESDNDNSADADGVLRFLKAAE